MIKIWPEGCAPEFDPAIPGQIEPNITPYIVKSDKLTSAVLVLPGGGYVMKAPHEGEPIALWLNSIGISAFVLDYRVMPYRHPVPLMDAQRAMRYIRFHAGEWNIDPNRIGILGFSAGGHLAASASTIYDSGDPQASDPADRVSCRPDCSILCYAVITLKKGITHEGSAESLSGINLNDDFRQMFSAEQNITSDTPPAFLWHTAEDNVVPVANSLNYALNLSKNKVLFELHIYDKGHHGLGLASDYPGACNWTAACADWLKRCGWC